MGAEGAGERVIAGSGADSAAAVPLSDHRTRRRCLRASGPTEGGDGRVYDRRTIQATESAAWRDVPKAGCACARWERKCSMTLWLQLEKQEASLSTGLLE